MNKFVQATNVYRFECMLDAVLQTRVTSLFTRLENKQRKTISIIITSEQLQQYGSLLRFYWFTC